MPIDREKYTQNYLDETKEHLAQIDAGAISLEKNPGDTSSINTVLRALHAIKGSSRMLGFSNMEQCTHAMENVFKGLKEERYEFGSSLLQLIMLGGEIIRKGITVISSEGEDNIKANRFLDACRKAADNEPFADDLANIRKELRSGTTSVKKPDASGKSEGTPSENTITDGYETIRVNLSDVEEITASLNSVIISQFQLKQFQERIGEIQQSYNNLGDNIRMNAGSMRNTSFEKIRKEMQNFKKDFIEQMAVVEQNSYKLQEQIMRLSMLPIDLVLSELPRMVAETSTMLEKEIDLSISGSGILMDKAILEKLNDPLIHIVRNAVDHAIETGDERQRLGKNRRGSIEIMCSAEGGNITIRIKDDGKGIDREQIISRAVERGLVEEDEVDELTETDVYAMIFKPGFSSRDEVSDLSGRGVGLDIVKVNIESVKGKVTVQSTPGEGSEFILAVPLSLATVSGFFVRSGGEKFLIPSNFVYKIVRIQKSDIISYLKKEAFRLDQQIIPLYSLSSLLAKRETGSTTKDLLYVVVVESMGERIGIIVDMVLQHVSLIYKPVPKNTTKLKPIQGIVFDENYRIINILFIPELMSRFRRLKSIDLIKEDLDEYHQVPVVLVVDDSKNTREIEESILKLEGYSVKTARDGIEALEVLRTTRIDLIVSDLDMPRMDGITMIENLRKNAEFGDIPVVVVTASDDDETVKNARAAGANEHIVKSDFNRNSLIKIAEKLLQEKSAIV
ncbi:MAG: response regulator [Spirochaetales bacterium]|nr:response regulator [Spirochaetales bacterium]MCF7938507.1 response regulator [Spirochaetales bacterium]